MATINSLRKMMKTSLLADSNTVSFLQEMNKLYTEIVRPYQETIAQFKHIHAISDSALLQAVQQAQDTMRVAAAGIREWQEYQSQIEKSVSPSLQVGLQNILELQIELQQLLQELYDSQPSTVQFNQLMNQIDQYASTVEVAVFEKDEAELIDLEREEVVEAVQAVLSEPENWEQRLVKTLTAKKERHPVITWAIMFILKLLINIVIQCAVNNLCSTIKPTLLRSEPRQSAATVMVIDSKQMVNVIDDVRYYFEIEYTEQKTGETYTGWVSKRSVQKPQ